MSSIHIASFVSHHLRPVAVALLGFVSMQASNAVPQYTVTKVQTPGVEFGTSTSINSFGQTAVYGRTSLGPTRAFRWTDGVSQLLGQLPGSSNALAFGISDSGTVVGHVLRDGSANDTVPTIWTSTGAVISLSLGTANRGSSYGINESGVVVGYRSGAPEWGGGTSRHATAWIGGQPIDLGVRSGANESSAEDVNEAGQIIGSSGGQAILWDANGMQVLGTASAHAINDLGQIVGNRGGQAALWFAGSWSQLGTLGGRSSAAIDINNSGDVVGISGDETGIDQATLWTKGTALDLNDLLLPGQESVVGRLYQAWSINESGQILVKGVSGHFAILNPQVAPPIPEPGTGALFLAGLSLSYLGLRRTRRAR